MTVELVLAGAVTVLLAGLVGGTHQPGGFDRTVVGLLRGVWPTPGSFALDVDGLGEPVPFAAIVLVLAGLALAARRWRLAVVAVLGPFAVVAATSLLKPVVGRTIHGDNLSYPSGHTAAATAVGLVVALLVVGLFPLRRTAGTLVLIGLPVLTAAVMAVDQVDLDAHYPTDTVGGFGTAVVVVGIVALLVDAVAEARPARRAPHQRSATRGAISRS